MNPTGSAPPADPGSAAGSAGCDHAPLWLASRSPRRRELLDQLGVAYRVLDVEVDERRLPGEAAEAYVVRVAGAKAQAGRQQADGGLVLAADTCVVLDGALLDKPADAGEAAAHLRALSGREHTVLCGVALAGPRRMQTRVSRSRVRFRPLAEAEVLAYAGSGEPLDKAGGYAIQGRAAAFIAHLDGSYSGVMGLALFETAELLAAAGQSLFGSR